VCTRRAWPRVSTRTRTRAVRAGVCVCDPVGADGARGAHRDKPLGLVSKRDAVDRGGMRRQQRLARACLSILVQILEGLGIQAVDVAGGGACEDLLPVGRDADRIDGPIELRVREDDPLEVAALQQLHRAVAAAAVGLGDLIVEERDGEQPAGAHRHAGTEDQLVDREDGELARRCSREEVRGVGPTRLAKELGVRRAVVGAREARRGQLHDLLLDVVLHRVDLRRRDGEAANAARLSGVRRAARVRRASVRARARVIMCV